MTKPALNELQLESTALDLWQEFLSGYFNNAPHTIGANAPIVFPSAVLRFQQSQLPQPLNGVGISVVWVRPAYIRYAWESLYVNNVLTRQQKAFARGMFLFWVRAELVETGTGNAAMKCRDAAQLLFGLLQNSHATQPLSQKGIHRLRPEQPQLVSEGTGSKPGDPAYATRMLGCACSLHYPVLSQVG